MINWRVTSTDRPTATISNRLKSRSIGCPIRSPQNTRTGATTSATWMLEPTVTPRERSILSDRAKLTALKIWATFPTRASRNTPANTGVRPSLRDAGSIASVRTSLMTARPSVTTVRIAMALFRLQPASPPAGSGPVSTWARTASLPRAGWLVTSV